MEIRKFRAALAASSVATRISILAVLTGLTNMWIGLFFAVVAVWQYSRHSPFNFRSQLAFWYFAPTAVALTFIAQGTATPSDDLLRHLTAGGLNYDYRAQYPWSNLPAADMWLGFDWLLWHLRLAGLSNDFLRQWIPGLSLMLQSLVMYLALRRAVPESRHNAPIFLLLGALSLFLLTPRSLLGRPEMFILIFAASAWLPRTAVGVGAWLIGFLLLIPFYWLGWAYAPFALLLCPRRLTLRARLAISAALGLAHLAFWQIYTGDYWATMMWLKGTLSVKATENAPLLEAFGQPAVWVFFGLLTFVVSLLSRRRLTAAAGVTLLFLWMAAPNQIRYMAALAFVAMPWIYRQLVVWRSAKPFDIPPVLVLLGLAAAAALSVQTTPPAPTFELPATAKVYSQSPYTTVFYSKPGITVEPSFAFGATKAEWRDLWDPLKEKDSCRLLQAGGFTHVIENKRKTLLECGELIDVQGPWRLWRLK